MWRIKVGARKRTGQPVDGRGETAERHDNGFLSHGGNGGNGGTATLELIQRGAWNRSMALFDSKSQSFTEPMQVATLR